MRVPENFQSLLDASPRVAALKRDVRGLPVPFVVMWSRDGKPNFIVNDTHKVFACVQDGLCSICGDRLDDGDVWFLGGEGRGLVLIPAGSITIHPSITSVAPSPCRSAPIWPSGITQA